MKKLRLLLVALALAGGFAFGSTAPVEAKPIEWCPLFACQDGTIFHCCADANGSYAHCHAVCGGTTS